MPPKKKKGKKKGKKGKKDEAKEEDKFRKTVREMEILKDHLGKCVFTLFLNFLITTMKL